jgi:hypothetical protein
VELRYVSYIIRTVNERESIPNLGNVIRSRNQQDIVDSLPIPERGSTLTYMPASSTTSMAYISMTPTHKNMIKVLLEAHLVGLSNRLYFVIFGDILSALLTVY